MAARSRTRERLPPWSEGVRAWLAHLRVSRARLARLAGLQPGTIAHIVRGGHCSTETLQKIAAALQIEMADLFTAAHGAGARSDARDRLVAAVLRELSEDVSSAVAQRIGRAGGRRSVSRVRERPLPFGEDA